MRIRAAISSLLLWNVGGLCADSNTDKFDSLIRQGRTAFEARDIGTASKFYDEACSSEAMSGYVAARVAFCHHQLATISSSRGQESDAEQHYLKAVSGWTNSGPQYLASWCVTLMNLGDL